MRGLLFTDFIDMIEAQYSPATADAILSLPGLTAQGAYTTVGVYEFREFNLLIERLAAHVRIPRSTILVQFGRFHFHKLLRLYPHLLIGVADMFALLERVDHPIHSTVTSLHPNAEVPQLSFERLSPREGRLTYRSPRGLADIAEGLILEAAAHYGQTLTLERIDLTDDAERIGEHACFQLTIADPR